MSDNISERRPAKSTKMIQISEEDWRKTTAYVKKLKKLLKQSNSERDFLNDQVKDYNKKYGPLEEKE